jgi:hypothetical protein
MGLKWTWLREAAWHVFLHIRATRKQKMPSVEQNVTTAQDYFAELYVSGEMAKAGWNVYFPHRDRGMDFVISKTGADGSEIIRPVQVKGKYPTTQKGDKAVYGYIGKLNQLHRDMVLAIPFFAANQPSLILFVAYMPFSKVNHPPASRLSDNSPQYLRRIGQTVHSN